MVTVMLTESKKSNRTRPALSFVFLLEMRDEDESSGKGEKGKNKWQMNQSQRFRRGIEAGVGTGTYAVCSPYSVPVPRWYRIPVGRRYYRWKLPVILTLDAVSGHSSVKMICEPCSGAVWNRNQIWDVEGIFVFSVYLGIVSRRVFVAKNTNTEAYCVYL